MTEFKKIQNLINIVKTKIDAHNKFKKEYDKQLAFDFSLFHFIEIGENKISQVLAYFLDENTNHGQGNIFLKEFVRIFYDGEIVVQQVEIKCEKPIDYGRRIDIYIELKGLTIAVENKIWADDQNNQLNDYSEYLNEQSKGKYLLLYLNPYGSEPKPKSISEELKDKLKSEEKLKIISYKDDIISLINNWLMICEADNVSHFLKEFKKYLEIKFLGKNTLNMNNELIDLLLSEKSNLESYQALSKASSNIKNHVIQKTVLPILKSIKQKHNLEFSENLLKNWPGFVYSNSKMQKHNFQISFSSSSEKGISNMVFGITPLNIEKRNSEIEKRIYTLFSEEFNPYTKGGYENWVSLSYFDGYLNWEDLNTLKEVHFNKDAFKNTVDSHVTKMLEIIEQLK